MRRSWLLILCVLCAGVYVSILPDVASAREFAEPPTLEAGDYKYVKNPDGTYTEYLGVKGGTPIRGNTYTEQEIKESDAIFAETAVSTGGAENPSSVVPDGADYGYSAATTENAAGQMQMDLQTGIPYKTAGEAAVGAAEISEGITSGWLPSVRAALTASAGVANVGVTVVGGLYWGVKIGDLADKYVFGIPTLEEALFGGRNTEAHGSPAGTQEYFETPRGGA